MAPSTVVLTGAIGDGSLAGMNGYVEASLSNDLVDSTDKLIIQSSKIKIPVVEGVLQPTPLVPNDDPHVPAGSVWNITHRIRGVADKGPYPIQILTTDGPTVDLSTKTPVSPPAPLPGVTILNTGTPGQILKSVGNFEAQWGNPTSGGTVTAVNSQPPDGTGNVLLTASQVGADAAGAAAAAQTAAINAAAASAAGLYLPLTGGSLSGALAMGSHKITGVTNGSVATDVATFGQLPVVGAAGSGASKALSANDPTTSDARTPLAHAASHAVGQSDALSPDSIGALSSDAAKMLGYGLLTADPRLSAVTYAQSPGDFVLCLCTASRTKSISTLEIWVTLAGVTGSGTNALYLYDELGNQIDLTGDLTAVFSTTGMVGGAMGGSHTVNAGSNYYIGFLTHFSGTQPHFAATGTTQTANFPVMNGRRMAIFKSGVATAPASFDPTTYTPNSGYFIMGAR